MKDLNIEKPGASFLKNDWNIEEDFLSYYTLMDLKIIGIEDEPKKNDDEQVVDFQLNLGLEKWEPSNFRYLE